MITAFLLPTAIGLVGCAVIFALVWLIFEYEAIGWLVMFALIILSAWTIGEFILYFLKAQA